MCWRAGRGRRRCLRGNNSSESFSFDNKIVPIVTNNGSIVTLFERKIKFKKLFSIAHCCICNVLFYAINCIHARCLGVIGFTDDNDFPIWRFQPKSVLPSFI